VKLARFRHGDQVLVGRVEGETVRPLGGPPATVATAILDRDAALGAAIPLADVTLLPPVDATARVFAVAQNYQAHAQEASGTEAPPAPVVFMKPLSALVGAGEQISWPRVTSFLDYEAELAVVIGSEAREVEPEQALAALFGAACFNDVTGRDLQPAMLGGKEIVDWFSAKSLDASSPLGPWIVSLDELPGSVDDLAVRCRVNGATVQDARTSSMVRSVAELIAFISQRVTLQPGDVIATGTPGGVGRARGVRLEDGDVVEVEIEGVGALRNRVAVRGPA
jgi:2-keto-4-pentenoate hydratase/2-oxohepta-3-ene-1,7-dioic acid hydratase in catechol pathway